ncbi:RNA polymerase sigma factor [Spirosoma gilvum]
MYQVVDTISDNNRELLATEQPLALGEYSSVVRDGLRQLSVQRRLVFTLRSEQGLTTEEVAEKLQISVSTVKDQYYHACRFLRDYLRQHAGVKAMLVVMTTFCN